VHVGIVLRYRIFQETRAIQDPFDFELDYLGMIESRSFSVGSIMRVLQAQ
jgi:hypothetical protein